MNHSRRKRKLIKYKPKKVKVELLKPVVKGGRIMSLVIKATPTLYGDDAIAVREEVMRPRSEKNKAYERRLLKMLERISK